MKAAVVGLISLALVSVSASAAMTPQQRNAIDSYMSKAGASSEVANAVKRRLADKTDEITRSVEETHRMMTEQKASLERVRAGLDKMITATAMGPYGEEGVNFHEWLLQRLIPRCCNFYAHPERLEPYLQSLKNLHNKKEQLDESRVPE